MADEYISLPAAYGYGEGVHVLPEAPKKARALHLDLPAACKAEGIAVTDVVNNTIAFTFVYMPDAHPVCEWFALVTNGERTAQGQVLFTVSAYIIDPEVYIATGELAPKASSFVAIDNPEIEFTLTVPESKDALALHDILVAGMCEGVLKVDRWENYMWGRVVTTYMQAVRAR